MVEGLAGKGGHASERGDVEDDAAAVTLGLSHHLRSACGHAHGAEEIGLELVVHLLFGHCLCVAGELVPGIVDENVNVELIPEVVYSVFESLLDRSRRRDVQRQFENGSLVGEVCEAGEVSGRCDETVARLAGYELGDGTADTTGTTSNYDSNVSIANEDKGASILNQVASAGS